MVATRFVQLLNILGKELTPIVIISQTSSYTHHIYVLTFSNSKACAPGVHSAEFEIRDQDDYWEYSHLCDLCHGSAGHYCERNHGEDYFGHTGAFRCLVEGGGNVAFVKVTFQYQHK